MARMSAALAWAQRDASAARVLFWAAGGIALGEGTAALAGRGSCACASADCCWLAIRCASAAGSMGMP